MRYIEWELENFPQNYKKLRSNEVIDKVTLTHVICNVDCPDSVDRATFGRVINEVAMTLEKVPFINIQTVIHCRCGVKPQDSGACCMEGRNCDE